MFRRILCCLILMFLAIPCQCGGESNRYLISSAESCPSVPVSLFSYSREVYAHMDDLIKPEKLTSKRVASIDDCEKEAYGTIVYHLEDDTLLALLYGNTIRFRTHLGKNHYQLWLLESESIKASPCEELDFMSIAQAKERALRFLHEYQISSPCIQGIYSVTKNQLEELTAHMKTTAAPEVSEYFTAVQKEHEAYYITLGHSFDEIPLVEQPNDFICISSEGLSCIELHEVGGPFWRNIKQGSFLKLKLGSLPPILVRNISVFSSVTAVNV